ncbi:hypothetical protein N9O24_00595 [bacterium]|nr:hypothetical protein [bacterium]
MSPSEAVVLTFVLSTCDDISSALLLFFSLSISINFELCGDASIYLFDLVLMYHWCRLVKVWR